MKQPARRYITLLFACAAAGVAVWAALHFTRTRLSRSAVADPAAPSISEEELWARGVEKVKADRGEDAGKVPLEIPPELKHYDERRWFLATQVAEVHKQNVQTCQDFIDLAAMIRRGEMRTVPLATENYILFGVGAKADDDVFTRYVDDHDIKLYDEAQLRDGYAEIETNRAKLQSEIAALRPQSGAGKKSKSAKSASSKGIAERQEQLQSLDQDKTLLDQFYGQTESREKLFSEYESFKSLAKDFGGRSFDIGNSADRQALRLTMLRSLRPEAFKVLEEIAASYRSAFDRPLPVSSLVRPEQYQHVLRKVNRNAVVIDTPPHSTGLAFDIDYRYMGVAEQNFVMKELARLKDAGRIEVIRERNANYHVFVFIDGQRPSDSLITASLDEVGPPAPEANHVTEKPAKVKSKKTHAQPVKSKSRSKKHRR